MNYLSIEFSQKKTKKKKKKLQKKRLEEIFKVFLFIFFSLIKSLFLDKKKELNYISVPFFSLFTLNFS